jgi:hypothetical protein
MVMTTTLWMSTNAKLVVEASEMNCEKFYKNNYIIIVMLTITFIYSRLL